MVAVAKQENNPTSIGLTQYLDPSYWTWAAEDPNGAALLQQGAEAILAYVVQRLEATGCEVATTAGSKRKLDHCASLGADILINYR